MAVGSGYHPVVRVPLAGLLGWVFPGLGHLFIGERVRGWVILVTVTVTFWGGVAIGGVRDTVDPKTRTAWFMGQICAGANALVAHAWGERIRQDPYASYDTRAHWRSAETAVVYTGVAGLLNLLAILDALARAEATPQRVAQTSPVRSRKGAT